MIPQLTIYITRYIVTEEQYVMFIECLEHVTKHIKDFDYNIIVFADNENEITKEYDDIILSSLNVKIIKPEFNINPEWYAYMYHYKYHPTEYMVYIMDNVMLSRDIFADKVINSINKYGCYSLCYNECISKWFKIRYDLIKIFIPELIELGSYKNYETNHVTSKHISAQGNQMFTSYECLCKVFNKFPNLYSYINNAKLISQEKLSEKLPYLKNKTKVAFLRDIRSLCDYVTSQCFFYTFNFPEKILFMGETEDCLYGLVISNWKRFKSIMGYFNGDTSWCADMRYFSIWNKMKEDKRFENVFVKFGTKRQQ